MKPEDRAARILARISMAVLLIDRDYVIVAANAAAASSTRRGDGVIVGRPCFEVTHGAAEPCWKAEGRAEAIRCPVKEAFETKQRARAIHRHEIDGRLVVEEIVATPLDEGRGQIDYVIEEFRDIAKLLDLREGILSICASCKKIRDDAGSWSRLEEYFGDHTGAAFSHSLCPDCFRALYPGSGDLDGELSGGLD